jgi:hypothetical protein
MEVSCIVENEIGQVRVPLKEGDRRQEQEAEKGTPKNFFKR